MEQTLTHMNTTEHKLEGGGGGEREAEDSPVEYKQQTHIKTHPQSTNSKLGWGVSSRIQSANTAKIDSPAEYKQQTQL